jgi:general nucleoside transport system ATP-binding protein
VHTMLNAMRARGGAVLLISDDLDEILKLSDRLIVLHAGEVMGEFGPESSSERIGLAMTGMHLDNRTEFEKAGAAAGSPGRHTS